MAFHFFISFSVVFLQHIRLCTFYCHFNHSSWIHLFSSRVHTIAIVFLGTFFDSLHHICCSSYSLGFWPYLFLSLHIHLGISNLSPSNFLSSPWFTGCVSDHILIPDISTNNTIKENCSGTIGIWPISFLSLSYGHTSSSYIWGCVCTVFWQIPIAIHVAVILWYQYCKSLY